MKNIRVTSKEVASLLYSKIVEFITPDSRILEPSAGSGDLIDYIKNKLFFNTPIDVVELNNEKASILKSKGYNLIGRDYMNTVVEDKYDIIVACPPFKSDMNLDHIQKMYSDLNRNGIIATLCNTKWITDNTEKSVKFREFLLNVNYTMTMIPDNSFMEKGKSVPSLILKIKK